MRDTTGQLLGGAPDSGLPPISGGGTGAPAATRDDRQPAVRASASSQSRPERVLTARTGVMLQPTTPSVRVRRVTSARAEELRR